VIADNDPTVVELLRTDLGLEGYLVVATAESGAGAAAACARFRPDVLIVDYRMPPGLNGLETIATVRAAGTASKAILYTNYRSADIAAEAARLGARVVAKGPLWMLRDALKAAATGT
jgi:DNA-binding NarL/FixJ family response regulator